ncbi:hypothetical protein [Pseudovibrio exalbescens]|uniref:Virginiamycin B lyase n=1 Tax=Pseudovibrio exalbescens TaxID=197461 RepID=A0A1U7JJ31_9HYPH|nr:hypothetical protein [Pseudovibrio exalbescens]OKL44753.1 hypothetical protein A3843_06645 [Pseudovibrio exalbescens]
MKITACFGALALLALLTEPLVAAQLQGEVRLDGKPLEGAPVVLWQTNGEAGADQLAASVTDAQGAFSFSQLEGAIENGLFYLTASQVDNEQLVLMAAIGPQLQEQVVLNELTTVATVFTHAQFMNGTDIRGNELGLLIAARNTPNLVDPTTGRWGSVVLDPLNTGENQTLARLNTLASLITSLARDADPDWQTRLFQLARPNQQDRSAPPTTIDVLAALAKQPWENADEAFKLFDEAYPAPGDGQPRPTPFLPYLDFPPRDFAMILAFAGGGIDAPARLAIDRWGNVWSGQIWMPGSLSSPGQGIGGGVAKMRPYGQAVSPAPTGWTADTLNGVDWGLAVTYDGLWAGALNGTIVKFNWAGEPVGTAADSNLGGELQVITGLSAAASEDVWLADGPGNQLVLFRNGDTRNGKIIVVDGLNWPHGIEVDDQDRVWVANAAGDTVIRFNASDPSATTAIKVPRAPRDLSLDSQGNIWVASALSAGTTLPDTPEDAPPLATFEALVSYLLEQQEPAQPQGQIYLIRPDASLVNEEGFAAAGALDVPWGLSVDGNDDVWVASLWNRSVVLLAGVQRAETSLTTALGEPLHSFQSGSIKNVSDVATDTAGNLWIANTWAGLNSLSDDDALTAPRRIWRGGGSIAVIYGIATPVHTPVVGQTRRP